MSTAILYHTPGTRSSRVAWFLYELEASGVDLDSTCFIKFVDLFGGETKKTEFLKVNPFGTVPTYINEKGESIIESLGILLYLSEKYKDKLNLIPKNKSKFHHWNIFGVSTLDEIVIPLFVQLKFTPEEKRDVKLVEKKKYKNLNLL